MDWSRCVGRSRRRSASDARWREIRMSPADGKLLAEIHRDGEVLDQRMEGDRLLVKARVNDALAGRLRRAGAEVTSGAGNGVAS